MYNLRTHFSQRFILATCLTFFALCVTSSPVPEPSASSLTPSDTLSISPPSPVVDWLDAADVGQDFIYGSSVFIVDDIVDIPSNSSTKRETAPQTTWYTQVNVDRTGTWSDCWATASSCAYGDNAPAGGSTTIGTSYSRSFSISFGLDAGLASNVEGVINGNGGLNLGFQWTRSWTWSVSYTCNVNSQVHVGQIFARPKFGWADTATRKCSNNYIQGTQCGGWTFGHIDFPLKSQGMPTLEPGCSQGWNNVHCNVPVGTKYC
ncbi:uncharacterized protein I303_105605 [Kwoniella dejecticola CBS 10117]|uniref:Uncharacterized protein n=1 Tax=Kwoniella dejecticola CBS 10117 TaxID=1296121 RepID=A0A1A6A210_9TREE|nr:uncharacterized protein I303_04952 [Kwoniella dejecticola CBS 10117]OBR84095.1 hypothetical protein I303_04952 [Kwoniella dejecticola CBS 10117]